MIISSYRIPNLADLLIYTAAFSGHFAFRNEKTGSWMIQSLCSEIDKSRPDEDLASILTSVSRSVAKKESSCSNDQDLHGKKQVPMKQAKLYVSGYPMFCLEARFQAYCCFSSNNWKNTFDYSGFQIPTIAIKIINLLCLFTLGHTLNKITRNAQIVQTWL